MTLETRMQRVIDAIEDTPEAVDGRSQAIAAITELPGYRYVGDMVVRAIIPAADAVLAKHPELLTELHRRDLIRYMTRQVIALAKGEEAVLDLPSRPQLN